MRPASRRCSGEHDKTNCRIAYLTQSLSATGYALLRMPPQSPRLSPNTTRLTNPRIHHGNSIQIHALPLHHPPDLHHFSCRASTSNALDKVLQLRGRTPALHAQISKDFKIRQAVVQTVCYIPRLAGKSFEVRCVCESDCRRMVECSSASLFTRPLSGGATGSIELAVSDLHCQSRRLEQIRAMGVVPLELKLAAGQSLKGVRRICSLQFDQIAELRDGLEFALAGVRAGGKVSCSPGRPVERTSWRRLRKGNRRLLLWRGCDVRATDFGTAFAGAGAAEEIFDGATTRVSLGI
jgi:hypothetical protein